MEEEHFAQVGKIFRWYYNMRLYEKRIWRYLHIKSLMTFLSQAAVPVREVAQHQVELWEQQMNKNDDHNEILSEQQLNNNEILHGLKKQNTTNWFLLCFEG